MTLPEKKLECLNTETTTSEIFTELYYDKIVDKENVIFTQPGTTHLTS